MKVSSDPWHLFLLQVILTSILFQPSKSLRHTFNAKRDGRFFIGPIGAPFGFVEGGNFNVTVKDFDLSVGHKSKKQIKYEMKKNGGELPPPTEVAGVHPGFLLKRFENEVDFAREADKILENPNYCAFENFKNDLDFLYEDEYQIGDDDYVNGGSVSSNPGVIVGDESEGIFLSMLDVDLMWRPNAPNMTHTFVAKQAGFYFLMYQLCLTGDPTDFLFKEVRTTFHLEMHHTNKNRFGRISYLTVGEMPLPWMFFYFSISYGMLLFLWLKNLYEYMNGKAGILDSDKVGIVRGKGAAKPTVYAIHHLMSILLALKFVVTLFESARYHYIAVYGHAELWSAVYYFFSFLKGVFLFTVILLIGSGWSFLKPFLNYREKLVISIVLILQVIDNIALVVLTHETEGETLYNDWNAVLHFVDILCCCAVLIPTVWQVNTLEKSVGDCDDDENKAGNDNEIDSSPLDPDAAKTLSKLKLFRSFYILVILYIYYTRVAVYLVSASLGYKHTWMQYLMVEMGTLAFYVVTGMRFRPMCDNPFFESKDNDENIEGQSLLREDDTIEIIELPSMKKRG
mmetsp:Transcript_14918/g.21346  ORF Transcript_14918/g.21346 Transcript_14918/m.21346 type:complete len:568 (+) Transcript_14918:34-1737(+)